MYRSRSFGTSTEKGCHHPGCPASVAARGAVSAEPRRATGLAVTLCIDGGEPVDATSVLSVLTLGIGPGERVTPAAEGDGADGPPPVWPPC